MSRLKHLVLKYGAPVLADLLGVVFAFYLALALRFAGQAPLLYLALFRQYVLPIAFIYCLFNGFHGLYNRLWRYASSEEVVPIVESVAMGTLVTTAGDLLWSPERPLPLSVVLAGGLFTLGIFVATRYHSPLITEFLRRWHLRAQSSHPRTRVLIVGAGEGGQLLAWRLCNEKEGAPYEIVGFVDDDLAKQGMTIHGFRVLSGCARIPEIVREEGIELIIIAIHNIPSKNFLDILSICQGTSARIKTLPNMYKGLQSRSSTELMRDITIEDLLGREPASVDYQACRDLLAGKAVLVTGAGGSIGSELCRQILQFEPRLLVMLDNNETSLYDLGLELSAALRTQSVHADVMLPKLCYIVADVTQRRRMERIFREQRPQIILHVAAYKHVPLMEEYPEEAIRVNVGGTLVVLELAAAYAAECFVFVSTDKAVNPASVMGSTKRLGEMLVTGIPATGTMIGCAVRFGNVLGSRGSVVPTFWKQIEMGGPITLTHPEATRFFMSTAEAASLILQAACLARGGEVFVLEMGEPVRILDLAHRMIRLRGLRVGHDIAIVYTGLRPGEKLHEELYANPENKCATSHSEVSHIRQHNHVNGALLLSETNDLLHRVQQDEPAAELRRRLFAMTSTPSAQMSEGTQNG